MPKNNKLKNGLIIDKYGHQRWYKDGKKHRENGLPAVEHKNGDKFWYQNNLFHRDNDLPAIEWSNGNKIWYQYGLKHRENGLPAIIYSDGTEEYWENGEDITKEESLRRKEIKDLKQTLTNTLPVSSIKSSLKKI